MTTEKVGEIMKAIEVFYKLNPSTYEILGDKITKIVGKESEE